MSRFSSYWELVDPIWDQVSIYDGGDTFVSQFREITTAQQTLFASHWAQSEICNGGFDQFFSNSTGVLAPEAAAGFSVLGMNECAKLIENAMSFFGDTYPRDRNVRGDLIEAHFEGDAEQFSPFGDLDTLFFQAVDNEVGGFEVAATQYANISAV